MSTLQTDQINHIITLLRQKFISPYKIIYMIDQKQADYFKARNKSTGCCSSSQITIPSGQQSKIQKYLSQMITHAWMKNNLNQMLEYSQDRYKNIIEKGKQDNLKITNQVQKYLVDNILAESINNYIFNKLTTKLSEDTKSISTEIGLWATPATWYSKYPHIKLELFEGKNLGELFNDGFTILENKIANYIHCAYQDLKLLEKDGRFQQILWKAAQTQNKQSNETKILRNPMHYANLQNQSKNFIDLARICVLLQSIPFELNMKANTYLTICDSIQAHYYKQAPFQKSKKIIHSKYEIFVCVNSQLNVKIKEVNKKIKAGSIVIVSNLCQYEYTGEQKEKQAFILKSYLNEAKRNN